VLIAPDLRRRALSLGAAKAVETATQFLLPMVLARCLDTATFGEYRLLWLAIGTVMALAPLNMPHSLFFFLPRSSAPQKRLYVHQVMLFLALAGALSALAISAWNPWLPATLHRLTVYDPLVPLLVAIWVPAYLLDVLPLVDERVRWQASVTIALAAIRTAALALAALSGDLGIMLMVLVVLALAKLALILWYVRSHYGLDGDWIEKRAFADHLSHSLPIGLWATLFQLRGQADQWIAATRFTLHSFAAFSIAALLSPLVTLCRQAVSEAFFPSMSRVQASGDAAGMLALNARANVMVATLLCPILGFAFAFAEEIITVIYTATYVEAAPVMRIYIIGLAGMVVEFGTLIQLLRMGPYAVGTGSVALALSVALSWFGAGTFGLTGAALGSVCAIFIERALIVGRIASRTGIPLRRLQEWRNLALALAYGGVAALLAWLVVHARFGAYGSIMHLCIGAPVVAASFGLIYAVRFLPLKKAWR
jgi:O-antigen/teichoic acid export membrane protein